LFCRFSDLVSFLQAGDVVDLDTNEIVKSDGKRKPSKKEKEEALRKEREQMR
jgi:hypothetical protein